MWKVNLKIVERWCMSLLNDVQMDVSINSQEYKSFEIDAVIIKISMTEYHHLINRQTYGLF